MAIFRSGLGEVKGKYGNLITYVVKGQNRVRATPLRYKDANTEEQQKQRTRLKFVCKFYSYAMQEPLLKEVWRAAAVPTPYDRYVLFRKVNMNACTAVPWKPRLPSSVATAIFLVCARSYSIQNAARLRNPI